MNAAIAAKQSVPMQTILSELVPTISGVSAKGQAAVLNKIA